MSKPREMSVDSWLAQRPETPRLLVTLKAVPDDDTQVLVTPTLEGGACSCSGGVRIDKTAIAGVIETDQTRTCCGGSVSLVELRLKPKASINLTDLFAQITAMQPPHPEHHTSAMPAMAHNTTPIGPQDPLGTSCFCYNGRAYCCRYIGFPHGWVCWPSGIACGPLNAMPHQFA